MKVGDGLLLIAMLIWLTVSVGPWYVGVGLFCLTWIVNIVAHLVITRWAKGRP